MQVVGNWQLHPEPLQNMFDDFALWELRKAVDEDGMVCVSEQLGDCLPENFLTAGTGIATSLKVIFTYQLGWKNPMIFGLFSFDLILLLFKLSLKYAFSLVTMEIARITLIRMTRLLMSNQKSQ